MRVVFLDVDGVLNHEAVYLDRRRGPCPLCPDACKRFIAFVEKVGASVVVSSAWRGIPFLETKLKRSGVLKRRHKDGRTVRLAKPDYTCRGDEIAEWLARHPEVTAYVIIDDEPDMLPEQMSRVVQTSFETGLTVEHLKKAEAILESAP